MRKIKRETILLCDQHDYKAPLISTMVFNGAELWCPYCGYLAGSFDGAGQEVPLTEALVGRRSIYKDHTEFFRFARGRLVCAYFETDNGVEISANEREGKIKMPDDMRKYYQEVVKHGWKYDQKASGLMRIELKDVGKDLFSCYYCKHDDLGGNEQKCLDAWKDPCFCGKFEFKEKKQEELMKELI